MNQTSQGRTILLLTTGLGLGGAERQVVTIAVGLKKRGWQVHVASMVKPTAQWPELERAEIPVHELDWKPGSVTAAGFVRYLALLKTLSPVLVHSHMVHANLLARVGRLFNPRVKVINTAHSINEGSRWRELAYRLTHPLASVMTTICEAGRQRYEEAGIAPKGSLRVIYNGIDTEAPTTVLSKDEARAKLGLPAGFLAVSLARLQPAKDIPTMLRAVKEAHASCPDLHVAIAGDGPEEARLKALAGDLSVADSITFLGAIKDIGTLLRAGDAFVMSSAWEGLPMALLEASMASLPLLATDVGGCREVIDDGFNGFLVPAHDPHRLAEALKRLYAMPAAERVHMGDNARKKVVTAFDIERICDEWEALYGAVLAR